MVLSPKRILKEIELLDWTGHVELPTHDMSWLANQLYVRLSQKDVDVCEACGNVAPLCVVTAIGPICADCVEDWNTDIDKMKEIIGE